MKHWRVFAGLGIWLIGLLVIAKGIGNRICWSCTGDLKHGEGYWLALAVLLLLVALIGGVALMTQPPSEKYWKTD